LSTSYTMDIENTVRVLTYACPDGMVLWHPDHPEMHELTLGQYSWCP
jgi:hypothetical protein